MSRIGPFLTTLLALVAVASCSDSRTSPTSPLTPGSVSATVAPTLSLGQTIDNLIPQVFPRGQATAAAARWRNIKRKLDDGRRDVARKMFDELVEWIQDKTGELTPPAGETQAHVAARLILYMSVYTFADPTQPPPPVPPVGVDATVALISPTAAATVITPQNKAGIALPAGAVSVPTVLVIYEDSVQVRAPCSGPLNTTLCQYPRFYHFDSYPHNRLNIAARVAVCHVTSGPQAPLRDETHDARLRVAHDLPSNPADYTPNASQVGGIEILPLASVGDFLLCGNTTLSSTDGLHFTNGLMERGWQMLTRVASAAGNLVTPKNLYAIDQGGGGSVISFSNFAVVDPVPVAQVLRYCPSQANQAGTYAVLDSAIAHAPVNGTVVVCDGTWPTDHVNITKAVTVRSEHSGGATLQQPASDDPSHAIFVVDNVPSGLVSLTDLSIQFTNFGVKAAGTYDKLLIDSVHFSGPTTGTFNSPQTAAVNILASGTYVWVVQNSFVAGDVGVSEQLSSQILVDHNTFSGQLFGATAAYDGSMTVQFNTITNCNSLHCIVAFNSSPSAMQNYLNNTIALNYPARTGSPMQIAGGTIGVSGNTLAGGGGTRDPGDPTTWPGGYGVVLSTGTLGTVSLNHISDVHTALSLGLSANISGSDNVFNNIGRLIVADVSTLISFTRSDFTNYTSVMSSAGPSTSLQCNYWGTTTGPPPSSLGGGLTPSMYTPYATQPIASQPTVSCP